MKKIIIFPLLLLFVAMVVVAGSATRSKKADISRNLQIFNAVYKELQTQYVDTIDADKTMRTAIDALLGQIDPYTEYYPADDQDEIT